MQNKRIALVTGANQGVGLQVAKELVANGLTVLVGSRSFERGSAAAKEIAKAVTARKPRTRYTVGRDAALLTLLARLLPDRILDRVFAATLRPYFPKRAMSSTTPLPFAGKSALVTGATRNISVEIALTLSPS